MTIKDRYPIGSNVCVHCSSEEEAFVLFELLGEEGYKWCSRDPLDQNDTLWKNYQCETCYSLTEEGGIAVGYRPNFQEEGWEIIEASDLLFVENEAECSQGLSNFLCGLMGK